MHLSVASTSTSIKPITETKIRVEVEMLSESRLQIHKKFTLLLRQEKLLQVIMMIQEGVSVHGMYFVINVCPSMTDVVDHLISLLLRLMFSTRWIVQKGPHSLGFSLPYGATWIDEGVVTHVQGGRLFTCWVGNSVTYLFMKSCDEAMFRCLARYAVIFLSLLVYLVKYFVYQEGPAEWHFSWILHVVGYTQIILGSWAIDGISSV